MTGKNWLDALNPDERRDWDEWVRNAENDLTPKLESSAFVMSLVPEGKPDVKFCVELGMSIMLDKPIIAVVRYGVAIPAKLRAVADHIITGDLGTAEGRENLAAVLAAVIKGMTEKEGEQHGETGT